MINNMLSRKMFGMAVWF